MADLTTIATQGRFGIVTDRILAIATQGHFGELETAIPVLSMEIDIVKRSGGIIATKRGGGIAVRKRSGGIVIES